MKEKYCVYKHIFPNNMVYVGITKIKPESRWGKNGYRYNRHPVYKYIKLFGWDNIEHVIIKENINQHNAKELEKLLIEHYKNKGLSCNAYKGGSVGDGSMETYIYNEKEYNMKELFLLSNVDGLTIGDLYTRIRKDNWDIKRALTQPKNVKIQPHGIGEKKYNYNGGVYNSYELWTMRKSDEITVFDITDRINHHGWSVERAITQPKKKTKVKQEYDGIMYSYKELAEISPVKNITDKHIRERVTRQGWTVEKAIFTPLFNK